MPAFSFPLPRPFPLPRALPALAPTPAQLPAPLRQRLLDLLDRLPAIHPPAFTVPPALARILARLPAQAPGWALVQGLNLALDRILPRAPLQPLRGRHLQLRVKDAGLQLDFSLGERDFHRLAPHSEAKPDLIITASTRDFIALALREEDPDTLFFNRRLRLEGDTELGLLVKNTLDAIDWQGWRDRLAEPLPTTRELP